MYKIDKEISIMRFVLSWGRERFGIKEERIIKEIKFVKKDYLKKNYNINLFI